jgi:hypothetical protein
MSSSKHCQWVVFGLYVLLFVLPSAAFGQTPAPVVRYIYKDTVIQTKIQGRVYSRKRVVRIAVPVASPTETVDTTYYFRPKPEGELLSPRVSDLEAPDSLIIVRPEEVPIPKPAMVTVPDTTHAKDTIMTPPPALIETTKATPPTVAVPLVDTSRTKAIADAEPSRIRPNPKDENLQSLRLQVKRGSTDAMIRLAEVFTLGNRKLTTRNPDSAEYYLKMAVARGSIPAHHLLGLHYLMGVSGKREPQRGLKLLTTAADSGYKPAFRRLVDQLSGLRGNIFLPAEEQLKPDSVLALKYALRGARLGDFYCAWYCAQAYHKGLKTPRNDSLAVHWLMYAARWLPEAQLQLADWFFSGSTDYGVNLTLALDYYEKASLNPKSNMDQQTAADIGIHYTGELPRILFNAYRHVDFMLPENALLLQFRQ